MQVLGLGSAYGVTAFLRHDPSEASAHTSCGMWLNGPPRLHWSPILFEQVNQVG